MSIQHLIYLPTLFSLFIVAVFILAKNSRNVANRLFGFFTLSILLWLTGLFLADTSSASEPALFWVRMAITFAPWVPQLFLLFSLAYPEDKRIGWSKFGLLVIPTLFMMITAHSSLMIKAVELKELVAEPTEVGPLYTAFLAYFALYFLAAYIVLFRKLRRGSPIEKSQIKFVMAGSLFAVLMNIIFNFVFVILGISGIGLLLGGPSLLIFVLFVTYAIVKHRLFDIRLIVARSVAYVLLLATLGMLYGLSVFGVSELFFEGASVSTSHQLVYSVLAVFLAFTFQPLRRFFEKLTDRIFYRDRYDTQSVLNKVGAVFASQLDMTIINRQTLHILADCLRPLHMRLLVLDDGRIYKEAAFSDPPAAPSLEDLQKTHQNVTVMDELNSGELRQSLREHDVNIVLRLKTQEGVVGYLLVGPKQSGSIYTNQDIQLFEIINSELAIALQNARSYEKITEFNITLQQRIEEATARLRVQNKKLKELDEAKDEFISMASHQLRTPLTTIKGYLSMLIEGDAGKIPKKQQNFLDLAFTSSERMVSLIADMLNVSRINTGKFVIEKANFDLSQMVAEEVKQLQRYAVAKNVKLTYDQPDPIMVYLDEGKMRQVVMNFIDNAIYYAPDGQVKVELVHTPTAVEFRVVDNGIGVPKDAQKHLFTKFFRAGNAQKVRPDGTGLGLYMAKMVVETQEGTIIFASAEGKGSTFGFHFPFKKIAPTPELSTAKAPAKAAASTK